MQKTPSPYKNSSQSPGRVAFTSSVSAKKKTVHEHWLVAVGGRRTPRPT